MVASPRRVSALSDRAASQRAVSDRAFLGAAALLFVPSATATVVFAVWSLIGVVVFPLGAALAALGMQQPAIALGVPLAAAVVVLVAGVLQVSAFTAHHLACCRDGVERFARNGEFVARAIGVVSVAAGAWLIAQSIG